MPDKLGISFCMINRDSIHTLNDCLASIAALADEIIVVDTGSNDQSPDLARSYGARVIFAPWPHDYSTVRNIYLKNAHCPWILSLDSDEILPKINKTNLNAILQSSPRTAFQFNIQNYFLPSDFNNDMVNDLPDLPEEVLPGISVTRSCTIRLFPNLPGIRYSYPIHESLVPSLLRMKINIKFLDIPIHHFGFLDENREIKRKLIAYQALGIKKITFFPGFYLGYFELGKLSLIEKNLDEAAKLFSICVRLNPTFVHGHYQLALTLFKLGRFSECQCRLQQALSYFPRHLDLIYLAGLLENQKGNFQAARNCFSFILQRRPFHYPTCLHLAQTYMKLGEYEKAKAIVLNVLRKYPNREEFYLMLAQIIELMGSVKKS